MFIEFMIQYECYFDIIGLNMKRDEHDTIEYIYFLIILIYFLKS
jgi:hypothetical protein